MSQTRLQPHPPVTEALQDGVYRAMLQVEYGKPGANEKLCRALAQVWNLAAAGVQMKKFIRWRSAITPVALSVLADTFTERERHRCTDVRVRG